MNKRYYILATLLLWTSLLFAQNINFSVSVSSQQVAVGEQFQVDFTLNGNGDRFLPPSFVGFQILSGPNVSSSMTSVNGNTTVSNGYSFILAADKEGDYTIGPATIYVNGHIVATRPVHMHVTKGQQPQNRRVTPQQIQQQQQKAQQVESVPASDLSKSLFIRAIVDKNRVYQGEQINVSYRVYTRVDILQNQPDKLPELNGFWSQELNNQRTAQLHTEVYNGIPYNVADIKQAILFPQRSGDLSIDPFGMTLVVREQRPARNAMEAFFGSFRDVKVTIKSPALVVHVKPLPEAGKPVGFSGAVGTFTMKAAVDKKALKANESLNYNVKISGTGNIKLFNNPTPNFPVDFEKYDPKITDTTSTEGGRLSGSKMYNYLLIPRHHGSYTIDPLKFSYFNPATAKYVTLSSDAFPIAVAKGDHETSVSELSSADKQDVNILNKDIRPIKTDTSLLDRSAGNFFNSTLYYLLLLLGPVLFIIALFYRRWHEKRNSDVVKVRSRRASKLAAKHLANAKIQMSTKNKAGFYEAVFKGIYGYLADKLNIPYGNLDKETIADALRKRDVSETLITQLQDTLDLCDMARFAPVSGISEQEMFNKAKNLINDIEDEI